MYPWFFVYDRSKSYHLETLEFLISVGERGMELLRPSSSMVNLARVRSDEANLSTTKRIFKFSREGFDMARYTKSVC